MGLIADNMIKGACCMLCGVYFVKEHGHPVVCKDYWNDLSKEEKKMYKLAKYKEL